MMPKTKPDDFLARAKAHLSDGDWNQAVAILENGGTHINADADVHGELIEVLRTLVVLQRVVGKFIQGLGWSRDDYHGFDQLEPGLQWDRSVERLQSAIDDLPDTSDSGRGQFHLAQDRYVCAEFSEAIDIASRAARHNPELAVACFYLSELACRTVGDLEQAKHFNKLLRDMTFVSSFVYRLQAEVDEAAGDYPEARFMFDMALRMPEIPVNAAMSLIDVLLCQQDFRDYDIFLLKDRFVATQHGEGYLVYDRERERLVEVRSSVPSVVKRFLQRFLPDRLYEGLRETNLRWSLYKVLQRRRPVDDFLESTTIDGVMKMVDGVQDGTATNSRPSSGSAES